MAAFAAARLTIPSKSFHWIQLLWLSFIALGFYIATITDSVNSVIILILICSALIGSRLVNRRIKFSIAQALIAVVIVAIISAGLTNSLQTNPKWRHVITDANIALDITHYPNWQNIGQIGLPLNQLNEPVNESDYVRIAYDKAGVEAILEHPLGYGVSRHAFERLVQKKYPDARIANSHNGYIDLTTAIGLPGLILLIAAILALFKQAKQSANWGNLTHWMIGSVMVYWLIDPISRDHYFYALLLLIGLFSALTHNNQSHANNLAS
jgi:O-antigen ligase